MKTRDLIKALQEEDPSGEIECCVGNEDIHFIEEVPAFYDGPLQVLIRDPNNKFYNIIGAKLVSSGKKIQIHYLSLEDAILGNLEIPITTENPRHQGFIDDLRTEMKAVIASVDEKFKTKEL